MVRFTDTDATFRARALGLESMQLVPGTLMLETPPSTQRWARPATLWVAVSETDVCPFNNIGWVLIARQALLPAECGSFHDVGRLPHGCYDNPWPHIRGGVAVVAPSLEIGKRWVRAVSPRSGSFHVLSRGSRTSELAGRTVSLAVGLAGLSVEDVGDILHRLGHNPGRGAIPTLVAL